MEPIENKFKTYGDKLWELLKNNDDENLRTLAYILYEIELLCEDEKLSLKASNVARKLLDESITQTCELADVINIMIDSKNIISDIKLCIMYVIKSKEKDSNTVLEIMDLNDVIKTL